MQRLRPAKARLRGRRGRDYAANVATAVANGVACARGGLERSDFQLEVVLEIATRGVGPHRGAIGSKEACRVTEGVGEIIRGRRLWAACGLPMAEQRKA